MKINQPARLYRIVYLIKERLEKQFQREMQE